MPLAFTDTNMWRGNKAAQFLCCCLQEPTPPSPSAPTITGIKDPVDQCHLDGNVLTTTGNSDMCAATILLQTASSTRASNTERRLLFKPQAPAWIVTELKFKSVISVIVLCNFLFCQPVELSVSTTCC